MPSWVFCDLAAPGRAILALADKTCCRRRVKLGKSPTGGWEYEVWLWRTPLICTTNHWPDPTLCPADVDWTSKQVVAVEVDSPVWEAAPKRGRDEPDGEL